MSPFKFSCANCGAVLIEEKDLHIIVYQRRRHYQKKPFSIPIKAFIRNKIGKHCPRCGRELSLIPLSVEVSIKKER